MCELRYKIKCFSHDLLLDLTFSIGRQNVKVKQIIKNYSRENTKMILLLDFSSWKGAKNTATGIEWTDECLKLIEQKKKKRRPLI